MQIYSHSHDKNIQFERKKIDKLLKKTQRVLYKISSVFPFDLFPNELVINENQVNVLKRRFFLSEDIETVLIKDIQLVIVETSPLFASLDIEILKPLSKSIVIDYLWVNEALKARRIIQGLRSIEKEGIDIANQPVDELLKKLEIIGKVRYNT
ncbi:hypothetical protein HY612_04645 [Candidatus Roizmanbacteria bacterium]|nr:hypothetical protein [Candidatus Roizmanbacteria bacterium]